MPEQRRSLVEGITQGDDPEVKELEKEFVYGRKEEPEVKPAPEPEKEPAAKETKILPQYISKAPLTTRVSPEIASALKRASLTRQLEGKEPCHVQEIMEEALQNWLQGNGHLDQ